VLGRAYVELGGLINEIGLKPQAQAWECGGQANCP
jgi:hypothetical protein